MVKTRSSSFAAAESDVTEERSSEPRTKRSKKDEKEVLDIGNGPDGNDDAILSVERYGDDNAPRYEDDEFDDGLINGDKDPLSTKKAKQIADKKKPIGATKKKRRKKEDTSNWESRKEVTCPRCQKKFSCQPNLNRHSESSVCQRQHEYTQIYDTDYIPPLESFAYDNQKIHQRLIIGHIMNAPIRPGSLFLTQYGTVKVVKDRVPNDWMPKIITREIRSKAVNLYRYWDRVDNNVKRKRDNMQDDNQLMRELWKRIYWKQDKYTVHPISLPVPLAPAAQTEELEEQSTGKRLEPRVDLNGLKLPSWCKSPRKKRRKRNVLDKTLRDDPLDLPETYGDRVVECILVTDTRKFILDMDVEENILVVREQKETTNPNPMRLFLQRNSLKKVYNPHSYVYVAKCCGLQMKTRSGFFGHFTEKVCQRQKNIAYVKKNGVLRSVCQPKEMKTVFMNAEKFTEERKTRHFVLNTLFPSFKTKKNVAASGTPYMYPVVFRALKFKPRTAPSMPHKPSDAASDICHPVNSVVLTETAPSTYKKPISILAASPSKKTFSNETRILLPAASPNRKIQNENNQDEKNGKSPKHVSPEPCAKEWESIGQNQYQLAKPYLPLPKPSPSTNSIATIPRIYILKDTVGTLPIAKEKRKQGKRIRKKARVEVDMRAHRKRRQHHIRDFTPPPLPPLPVVVDIAVLVEDVDTGRYPSMKRYFGEHGAICDVCKKGGELFCCEFCPRTNHLLCLRTKITIRDPGSDDDFMCVKCAQQILNRRSRAERRRLTKMAIALKAAGELKPIVDEDNEKEEEKVHDLDTLWDAQRKNDVEAMELADAVYAAATAKKSSIAREKADESDINRKENVNTDDEHSVNSTNLDSTNATSTAPQTAVATVFSTSIQSPITEQEVKYLNSHWKPIKKLSKHRRRTAQRREVIWNPADDITSHIPTYKPCQKNGPGGLICCEDCTSSYSQFLSETTQEMETQINSHFGHQVKELMNLVHDARSLLQQTVVLKYNNDKRRKLLKSNETSLPENMLIVMNDSQRNNIDGFADIDEFGINDIGHS